MAIPSKTVPPFEAPEFFTNKLCQKNGGLKGLRAMRRAWAEVQQNRMGGRHPRPRQIHAKGQLTRSAIAWLQARAVELFLENTRSDLQTAAG